MHMLEEKNVVSDIIIRKIIKEAVNEDRKNKIIQSEYERIMIEKYEPQGPLK